MIELIAAMAVLAILVTAASVMLVKSFAVTGTDRQRVRAANVAAQEVDRVRGLMVTNPASIASGATVDPLNPLHFTLTSAPNVAGTVFSVSDDGVWQSAQNFNALNLTIKVSWANMQGVQPVVNSAALTIRGTSGNHIGGNVVDVSTAPAYTAPAGTTISPSCALQSGAVSLAVASTVSTPSGVANVAWDGTYLTDPIIKATVQAQAAATNPCGTSTTIALTYANGAFTGTLPYGDWVLTAKLGDGSLMTENLTVNAATVLAPALTVADNCGGANSVQYNVSSSLLGQIVGATVTGSRSSTPTCSVPVTTTFTTAVGGLFTGATAFGNWSFNAAYSLLSGPVSAAVTVGVGTTTINLNDTGCPSIIAPITLTAKQAATIYGTTTTANLSSGTITATRAVSGGCGATTVSIPIGSNGSASANLAYGNWTFSINGAGASGSWPGLSILASTGQNATVTAAASCSSTLTPVTVTVHAPLLTAVTGILRARMQGNGTICQPAGANTSAAMTLNVLSLLLSGNVNMNLLPGTYTFSVDSRTTNSSSPATLTVPGTPTTLTLTVN